MGCSLLVMCYIGPQMQWKWERFSLGVSCKQQCLGILREMGKGSCILMNKCGSLDFLSWILSSWKIFEVRSYYSVLVQPSCTSFPWRSVWKTKVPTRLAFFIWTEALAKILTIDNLRQRSVIIMDWCCMCKSGGELVNHMLLHCNVAQELWNMILILFGVFWVMTRDVVDLLSCWPSKFGRAEARVIWKAIPNCPIWCLWCERNSRTFSGEASSIPALKFYFLQTLSVKGL